MHAQPQPDSPLPGGKADNYNERLDILTLFERPAWHAEAACHGVGHTAFFPGRGESTALAKSYCDGCPVRQPCLDSALAHRDNGVWAGTSGRERRKIRKLPIRITGPETDTDQADEDGPEEEKRTA